MNVKEIFDEEYKAAVKYRETYEPAGLIEVIPINMIADKFETRDDFKEMTTVFEVLSDPDNEGLLTGREEDVRNFVHEYARLNVLGSSHLVFEHAHGLGQPDRTLNKCQVFAEKLNNRGMISMLTMKKYVLDAIDNEFTSQIKATIEKVKDHYLVKNEDLYERGAADPRYTDVEVRKNVESVVCHVKNIAKLYDKYRNRSDIPLPVTMSSSRIEDLVNAVGIYYVTGEKDPWSANGGGHLSAYDSICYAKNKINEQVFWQANSAGLIENDYQLSKEDSEYAGEVAFKEFSEMAIKEKPIEPVWVCLNQHGENVWER